MRGYLRHCALLVSCKSQRHTPIVVISRNFECIFFYVRSFTTMTTVGYGDVNPVSNAEKIFAMVAMMVWHIYAHYPWRHKNSHKIDKSIHMHCLLLLLLLLYMICAVRSLGGLHFLQFHNRFYFQPYEAQPKRRSVSSGFSSILVV